MNVFTVIFDQFNAQLCLLKSHFNITLNTILN